MIGFLRRSKCSVAWAPFPDAAARVGGCTPSFVALLHASGLRPQGRKSLLFQRMCPSGAPALLLHITGLRPYRTMHIPVSWTYRPLRQVASSNAEPRPRTDTCSQVPTVEPRSGRRQGFAHRSFRSPAKGRDNGKPVERRRRKAPRLKRVLSCHASRAPERFLTEGLPCALRGCQ